MTLRSRGGCDGQLIPAWGVCRAMAERRPRDVGRLGSRIQPLSTMQTSGDICCVVEEPTDQGWEPSELAALTRDHAPAARSRTGCSVSRPSRPLCCPPLMLLCLASRTPHASPEIRLYLLTVCCCLLGTRCRRRGSHRPTPRAVTWRPRRISAANLPARTTAACRAQLTCTHPSCILAPTVYCYKAMAQSAWQLLSTLPC